MNLRKALDKAQQDREEQTPGRQTGGFAATEPKSRPGNWEPPVYSESAHRGIEPATAIEHRCVCLSPEAPETEYYKILRTQILQRTQEKGWKAIMITSAVPGEGKTLTAINLALTFARKFNQTVLLVDGDLRKQEIHQRLGIASDKGLGDYLLDESPLKDLIIWPGIEKMTVISGGKKIPNSTELLDSPRMKSLVAEMRSRYQDRYVFFDVPALLDGADSIAFAPSVDGILMVIEAGKTSLPEIQKALKLIPEEKFLGFVLNRAPSGSN